MSCRPSRRLGGTTWHKLAKCDRHPKKSQVLAQVGRGSLGTGAPECRGGEVVPQGRGWCRGRQSGCRKRRRGVPRTTMEGRLETKWCVARDENAQCTRSKAGHGPLTNPGVLADPWSTPTSSQLSSRKTREIGKRHALSSKFKFCNILKNTKSQAC